MVTITVVNKHKDDDLKAIYIGRGSALGNPFPISDGRTRAQVIDLYRVWLDEKIKAEDWTVCNELNIIAMKAQEPNGVKLKCFCKPLACHGDIIKDVVLKALNQGS
jgi:hypothetical protein